jgi:hypothetical protein
MQRSQMSCRPSGSLAEAKPLPTAPRAALPRPGFQCRVSPVSAAPGTVRLRSSERVAHNGASTSTRSRQHQPGRRSCGARAPETQQVLSRHGSRAWPTGRRGNQRVGHSGSSHGPPRRVHGIPRHRGPLPVRQPDMPARLPSELGPGVPGSPGLTTIRAGTATPHVSSR